jgi:nucleoside-diphosphate-sugar epimerase
MTRIVMTGASGVLGAVVAAELVGRSELTCLTRRRRSGLGDIREVVGDLTQPRLGLDARGYASLASGTDVIVHSAALTSFGRNGEAARAVNVEGTKRVVELAIRANARLVHISTAFVARSDEFAGPQPSGMRSPVGYLRSKIEAEAIVIASGLQWTIVRPSILIGDSRTGIIGKFQGWHKMCEAIVFGQAPFLPAAGSCSIDCIPVDFAGRAVADLALTGGAAGEWWLTAGEDSFTVDQSIDLCLAEAAERGLTPPRPRTLPREMVERLVLPAFGEQVPSQLRRQLLEGVELMRLFGSEHVFPRRWPTGRGVACPSRSQLVHCFQRSLRHLGEQSIIEPDGQVA